MPIDKVSILKKMAQMKEVDFTNTILVPLLYKMHFASVDVCHGPNERGKDIVCIKTNEIDELDILAIQVKKLKFTGRITSSGHIIPIINQCIQCMTEQINLKDGTVRHS